MLDNIISYLRLTNIESCINYNREYGVAVIDMLKNRKGNAEVWIRYHFDLKADEARRLGYVMRGNDRADAWDLNRGTVAELIDWLKRDIKDDIFVRYERSI